MSATGIADKREAKEKNVDINVAAYESSKKSLKL